ncbi:hypothetical protein JYP46_20760 [Nitratireductor aquimarinus]|uniref:hypothetical protein n=1 Tax=Alphaproteobacteria TaxID=28211 RepID=UPI0019D320F6|nr:MULTISPECIES: hypothetical protein [Alphaproteobacteria]MBN7759263.1 hypothetical protein [Nitratireductor aquimarinus]MBY6001543.1 hypothetical protein [Tritonibacter mobilis]MBY6023831.1 hypothetical protein [Nitratireductor sp. DP7N14-4]
MSKGKNTFGLHGLTVNYAALGTISIQELAHAVLEDVHALRDIYNIQYVRGSRLKIIATNEYGEQLNVIRPTGGSVHYLDTHHYRPACKDYDL